VFAAPHAPSMAGMTVGDCTPSAAPVAPALPSGMALADCGAAGADAVHAANVQHAPAEAGHPAPGGHDAPAEEAHGDETSLEWTLMAVSTLVALSGIGLAAFLWLRNQQIPARLAQQFAGVHRVLLHKYYVDELYDAAIVWPIHRVSRDGLWRGLDVRVVDGLVNLSGQLVGGLAAVLRLLQTGSVRTYAASTFLGAVAILGYYLWR
jgi:NADH-quinone oxidoreductase subunit L